MDTMTDACRALVDGVEHRARRAWWHSRLKPRTERQAFIYETTFQNEIEAVAYPLAKALGRIPNFATPKTYSEKLRGLYLTHPNPLLSLAADKVEMRRYCMLRDSPIMPPRLLAVHDDPMDLALDDLPEAAMIKISDGCKANILHAPGMPLRPAAYRLFLRRFWHIDHWRRHAELHYRDIPRRILVEEAILPIGELQETGIHCAFGEPYLARTLPNYQFTPLGNGPAALATDKGKTPVPLSVSCPEPLREAMMETARRLSAPFPHCRVDFMYIGERCYLSELTISPSGFFKPHQTPGLEELRGDLYDFAKLPETLAQGHRIAADLGWPTETSFGHYAADDPRLATGGK